MIHTLQLLSLYLLALFLGHVGGVKVPGNEANLPPTYGLQTIHKLGTCVNYTKPTYQNDLSGLTLTGYLLWLDSFPGNSQSCPN